MMNNTNLHQKYSLSSERTSSEEHILPNIYKATTKPRPRRENGRDERETTQPRGPSDIQNVAWSSFPWGWPKLS